MRKTNINNLGGNNMKKLNMSIVLVIIMVLSIGITTAFAVTASNPTSTEKDTSDFTVSQTSELVDTNSVGVGRGYDLTELENWFTELQAKIKIFVTDNQLMQEQADELLGYYENEIKEIKANIDAGGINVFDKTDSGLVEVFYTAEQLSYEPPVIDEAIQQFIYKNRTLGIATILPTG